MEAAAKADHRRPAGERARGFLHVLLAVVTLAEREELHHFTRKILVGASFAVLCAVEVDHHRRIAGNGVQEIAEVAERVRA